MKKGEKFSQNSPAGGSWSGRGATPAPTARPGPGPLLPRWRLVSAEPRTAGARRQRGSIKPQAACKWSVKIAQIPSCAHTFAASPGAL